MVQIIPKKISCVGLKFKNIYKEPQFIQGRLRVWQEFM